MSGPDVYQASLTALRASAEQLAAVLAPLDDAAISGPSYDDDWTIADVLSHLGSGAVILQRRITDGVEGRATPDDFPPSVWDEWNAKSPRAKVDDGLVADRELIERFASLGEEEKAVFRWSMGPVVLDITGLIGLRLNESVFHTWDVRAANVSDPGITLLAAAVPLVVDDLFLIARFTARPTGSERTITVETTDPTRYFAVTLAQDSAGLESTTPPVRPDLILPAEAFARLVFGRLDPDRTPPYVGDPAALDELRRVFPGP